MNFGFENNIRWSVCDITVFIWYDFFGRKLMGEIIKLCQVYYYNTKVECFF